MMEPLESNIKIFISYRRSGESGFVGRLTDRLSSVFGANNIFRDVSGLRYGDDFQKRIGARLSEATVVIAVIGDDWCGQRLFQKSRIQTEGDWVRKELEHALATETPVIPILIGDAVLPSPNRLPASLKELLAFNTGRIRDESWENDFSELRKAIEEVVQRRVYGDDDASFVWRRVEANESSRTRLLVPAIAMTLLIAGLFLMYPKEKQVQFSVQLNDSSTWISPPLSEARSQIAHLALQIALLELQASTKEANEKNDGFNVSKFTQRFNLQNVGWSSAFVTWCYLEAIKRKQNNSEAKPPFIDSPSTVSVANSLRKNGWLTEPFNASEAKPGDIVFFGTRSKPIIHSEIIYATDVNTICSIGGNVKNKVTGSCRPINSKNLVAIGTIPEAAFE